MPPNSIPRCSNASFIFLQRISSGTTLALDELLEERHVLVASDSVPQGFERRVDNLAAAVTFMLVITG